MLIKLRQHIIHGLQLSQDPNRTLRFSKQKPGKASQEPITTVRESANSENTTATAATINGNMFADNIDFPGKADPQQLAEWICELPNVPEDERAGSGKQLGNGNLFAANEIQATMAAVYAKHKTESTKNRAEVAKWGKYYAMASR